jgi:glycosyltransferase involved in cell wall biosynthesis
MGLLYSGSFGRAHAFERTLSLARRLRGAGVAFGFSVRGNAESKLRAAVTGVDANIGFHSFVADEQLDGRLGAADIHIVTLRDEWTGAVVPSKFFGALAAGRPVLFEGSPDCAIAQWIMKYKVGWVLTAESEERIAAELSSLCEQPPRLEELSKRAHEVYVSNFSRKSVLDGWHRELSVLCSADPTPISVAPADKLEKPAKRAKQTAA